MDITSFNNILGLWQEKIKSSLSSSVTLSLNYAELWNEFNQVETYFDAVKTIIGDTPITKIIIAEAPTSVNKYIYNPLGSFDQKGNVTDFIKPSHFGLSHKTQMIQTISKHGILIFDLYPFSFPSFIYRQLHINASEEARTFFNDFWNEKFEGLNISEDVEYYLAFSILKKSFVYTSFLKRYRLKKIDMPILDKNQLRGFINPEIY
jgi:hypothetical protein